MDLRLRQLERSAARGDTDAEARLLQGRLRTRDLSRAHRFVRDLEAGAVWVNSYRRIHWAVPFGGFKDSGYGRDSGLESLRGYQQTKSAWIELG